MKVLLRRFLDWKFVWACVAMLMVVYLVVGGYQDNVAKGHRIDALIAIGQAKDRDADARSRAASLERDRLLANQAKLLRLFRQQARRQEAFGRYLQRQGFSLNIPERFRDSSLPANKNQPRRRPPATPKTVPHAQPQNSGTPDPRPPPQGDPSGPGVPDRVRELLDRLQKGLLP